MPLPVSIGMPPYNTCPVMKIFIQSCPFKIFDAIICLNLIFMVYRFFIIRVWDKGFCY